MNKQIGNYFFRLLPVFAALLVVIEIILMNQMASSGSTLQSVDTTIDTLRSENSLLEQKVASASSLATIESRATEMGFVQPGKNQYLTVISDFPMAMSTLK